MNLTPTHIAVLVALGAVGAGVSIMRSRVAAGRRRHELASFAAELGWSFSPERDPSHHERFAALGAFRRGGFRAAFNTIEGSLTIAGRRFPCRMGDYSFHEAAGGDGGGRERRFSYMILHLPFPAPPGLFIRRENRLDRVRGALGLGDIALENREFSDRFHVTGPDRGFASALLDAGMMEWLLAVDPPVIEVGGGVLCLTDDADCWTPEGFRRRMAFAAQFLDRWPERLTGGAAARAG